MNKNECEFRLRAAKPMNSEITPLSPEASSRILSAALRANRRKPTAVWLTAPLRVAMSSAAVAAFVYCLVPYVSTTESPVAENITAPAVAAAPSVTKNDPETARVKPAVKKSAPRGTLPKLPSTAPAPIRPQVMVAKIGPAVGSGRSRSSQELSREKSAPRAVINSQSTESGAKEAKKAAVVARNTPSDEGNMFVSVSGDSVLPPESEPDDTLQVTVARNVPETVSGSAEAAALHSVPMPGATPTPTDETVPVWTHVRVETGEEPVMTLTALH